MTSRRSIARGLGLALACAMLSVPAVVHADEAEVFAIAPGNEAVLSRMLGAGATLPAGCSLASVHVEQTHVLASFQCGSRASGLELRHPRDPLARARAVQTARFAASFDATMPAPLVDELARRIRADEAEFHWTRVGAPPRSTIARERRGERGAPTMRLAELGVAYALTFLSVPALVLAVRRVLRDFARRHDGTAPGLALAVVVGVLARLAAPLVLVTMYIGYLLTQQAIDLSIDSHYGLASQVPYHLLLSVFPHDHRTIMRFDSLVGMISIPMIGALAARLARDPRVGVIVAFLVALVPLFVKNDDSEANNVPMLLALFSGLLLLAAHVESTERAELAGAVVLIAFASVARPEMPFLAPVFVVAVLACVDGTSRARFLRSPVAWISASIVVVLAVPHLVHVLDAAEDLSARAGLGGTHPGALSDAFVRGVVRLDTVLTPTLFPPLLPLFALVGVVGSDPALRRGRMFLLGAAVLALGVYGVDLCTANMARVHVPAALLVTILAGMGFVRTVDAFRAPVTRRVVVALGLFAVGLSAVPSARRLWAPTNEQAEEVAIRASIAALPPRGSFTWVRIDGADSEPGARDPTHRHFPDYLLRPPARSGRTSSIRDFLEEPDFGSPAFFYWGTRCHARFRAEGTRPPHGLAVEAPCRAMRERFELVPVHVERIPNRGDVWLEYYGDAEAFEIGLYRILPRAPR